MLLVQRLHFALPLAFQRVLLLLRFLECIHELVRDQLGGGHVGDRLGGVDDHRIFVLLFLKLVCRNVFTQRIVVFFQHPCNLLLVFGLQSVLLELEHEQAHALEVGLAQDLLLVGLQHFIAQLVEDVFKHGVDARLVVGLLEIREYRVECVDQHILNTLDFRRAQLRAPKLI